MDVLRYQIRQSFKLGEITLDEVNRIGYETAIHWTKRKSSAQSRTFKSFGQVSNQEVKYIIDGLSILGGKLRNFCVKLIVLLSYTRINDIAKYHICRNTECVHNIN